MVLPLGFSATLFYTTIYAVTLIGAFAVTGMVRRETGGDNLQNFAGLAARSPFAAACMSIFMLSLAGLPPLAGFFGKFYLFSVALRADRGLFWLVIVALFGSFVSLYYYLIVLKFVFVEKSPELGDSLAPLHFITKATIAVLAAAVLVFGLLPQALTAQILAALP